MLASRRPKYLNLYQIRLPVPGLVSILHRVSGAALFVFAWALLWLLQLSLRSPDAFDRMRAVTGLWFVKLFLVGMLWAFLHHFFAGLRFLLLDVHVAVELDKARKLSWAVLGLSLVLTLILGMRLW
ncbi:MAG TPA: succinate dehydrogenase, cytochrome b556 subunit [Burkholderiales bacterium]|nr:succinate dehydrogenase, cytochrome b556 subunit [Burkholderiales bacterium]